MEGPWAYEALASSGRRDREAMAKSDLIMAIGGEP